MVSDLFVSWGLLFVSVIILGIAIGLVIREHKRKKKLREQLDENS